MSRGAKSDENDIEEGANTTSPNADVGLAPGDGEQRENAGPEDPLE